MMESCINLENLERVPACDGGDGTTGGGSGNGATGGGVDGASDARLLWVFLIFLPVGLPTLRTDQTTSLAAALLAASPAEEEFSGPAASESGAVSL